MNKWVNKDISTHKPTRPVANGQEGCSGHDARGTAHAACSGTVQQDGPAPTPPPLLPSSSHISDTVPSYWKWPSKNMFNIPWTKFTFPIFFCWLGCVSDRSKCRRPQITVWVKSLFTFLSPKIFKHIYIILQNYSQHKIGYSLPVMCTSYLPDAFEVYFLYQVKWIFPVASQDKLNYRL